MKIVLALVVLGCGVWDAYSSPAYYPYYGANMDSLSYGASDSSRGAVVMNRYYQPYYPRGIGGGMAAFMFQQPQHNRQPSNQGYYQPDKGRQTDQAPDSYLPAHQNEVFPPQTSEKPAPFTTRQPELAETTERSDAYATTLRTTAVPEIQEPEVEEVEEQRPRKRVSKKKQVKRPIDDEDEDEYVPKMPAGAFFPMFFGWGGRSSQGGGAPGVMAIANAYSTGRGGVSSSHATAYGAPRPEEGAKL